MKRRANQYPDDLKLKVAQEYLQTDLSIASLMAKYGIRGKSCITNWICKFGLSFPTEDQLKINSQLSKEINKTPQERELEQKLEALEKDLAYERLRTKALNTMIDIAEKELKISIRKKSGAKQ